MWFRHRRAGFLECVGGWSQLSSSRIWSLISVTRQCSRKEMSHQRPIAGRLSAPLPVSFWTRFRNGRSSRYRRIVWLRWPTLGG